MGKQVVFVWMAALLAASAEILVSISEKLFNQFEAERRSIMDTECKVLQLKGKKNY